ncbi:helix-turn-helix domain-containing protein [Shimia sp.]|uniref:AraC family transcriptional regulator n=1 Tax=Shimia sp. TaxID=1954381 RepID=UPI00356161B5
MRTERLKALVTALDDFADGPAAADAALAGIGLGRNALTGATLRPKPGSEAAFLQDACKAVQDDRFAALAGLAYRDGTVQTGCICKYSRTLRNAINHTARFLSNLDPGLRVSLKQSGNSAALALTLPKDETAGQDRFAEFLMFSTLSRLRRIAGAAFLPLEIRFSHAAPHIAESISRQAGCAVTFGAGRCEMILAPSVLELPVPGHDPNLRAHELLQAGRPRPEASSESADLRHRVEAVLLANLPGRVVLADEVAGNLGMSRRTFARRMREQGLSYRTLLDELRCELACTYLGTGYSINEIAVFLDYADPAAFSTAFRRWTGTSPNRYRRQYRLAQA